MIERNKPFRTFSAIFIAICIALLVGASQIPSLPAEIYCLILIAAVFVSGLLQLIGQMFNGE